jgi:hypothetical protein
METRAYHVTSHGYINGKDDVTPKEVVHSSGLRNLIASRVETQRQKRLSGRHSMILKNIKAVVAFPHQPAQ